MARTSYFLIRWSWCPLCTRPIYLVGFLAELIQHRAHQTSRSGRLFRLGFNETTQFLSKSEVLVALSVFSSQYLFHQYSRKRSWMFLKFDPYRVWCSIFYSKLVNCILFKIIVQHVRFVKGRGTCGSGERNVNFFLSIFKSLPDFPSLRP